MCGTTGSGFHCIEISGPAQPARNARCLVPRSICAPSKGRAIAWDGAVGEKLVPSPTNCVLAPPISGRPSRLQTQVLTQNPSYVPSKPAPAVFFRVQWVRVKVSPSLKPGPVGDAERTSRFRHGGNSIQLERRLETSDYETIALPFAFITISLQFRPLRIPGYETPKATGIIHSQPLHARRIDPKLFGNFGELLDATSRRHVELNAERSFEVTKLAGCCYYDGSPDFATANGTPIRPGVMTRRIPLMENAASSYVGTRRPASLTQSRSLVKRDELRLLQVFPFRTTQETRRDSLAEDPYIRR